MPTPMPTSILSVSLSTIEISCHCSLSTGAMAQTVSEIFLYLTLSTLLLPPSFVIMESLVNTISVLSSCAALVIPCMNMFTSPSEWLTLPCHFPIRGFDSMQPAKRTAKHRQANCATDLFIAVSGIGCELCGGKAHRQGRSDGGNGCPLLLLSSSAYAFKQKCISSEISFFLCR